MVENVTANRNYPLPDPSNTLETDVERLIPAIHAIDADVATLVAGLASKVGANSPSFSGVPTAPTAVQGTNNTQIATTQFTMAAAAAIRDELLAGVGSAFEALQALAGALADDPEFAGTVSAELGNRLRKDQNLSDLTDPLAAFVNIGFPVGATLGFCGTAAPPGWLLCYGQAVSRTTYAALFNVIGTTFGSDDSTTFKLPDYRGRVGVGADNMGGTSANRLTNKPGGVNGSVLGATGGSETHTLTIAQAPVHDHDSGTLATGNAGAHTHDVDLTVRVNDGSGNFVADSEGGSTRTASSQGTAKSAGVHTHPVTGTTATRGGGAAHNNVQPSIVENVIIFAGA
jgi:microcystin-dependent protein